MAAVACAARDGTVLMQRRRAGGAHGGLWEFPGGKVEPGETPEAAAVREIEEELGAVIALEHLEPVGFASGTTEAGGGDSRPVRPLVILCYAVRRWTGHIHAREAEECGWYAPSAIAALAMPPLDYPLAQALCRHLDEYS